MMTIDRQAHLAHLMIAYKRGDLNNYLKALDKVKNWLPDDLYNFYFNLSKSNLFARKGYFKQ